MRVPGIYILKSYLVHLQTGFGGSKERSLITLPQFVPWNLIPQTPTHPQGTSGTAKVTFQLENLGDPSLVSQPSSPQVRPVPGISWAVVETLILEALTTGSRLL